MNIVTLIRHRSGFTNIPDSFAVVEPDYEDSYDEFTESVDRYALPPGYHVAMSQRGEQEIYDAQDRHCEIVQHKHTGRPQLFTSSPASAPVLEMVKS